MSNRIFNLLLVLLFFVLMTACDNDYDGFTKSDSIMTFTTMDVNLGDDLAFYNERVSVLDDVFYETDADVLCIQGLYYSKDLSKVKDFLDNELGYDKFLWLVTSESDIAPVPAACSQEDVSSIYLCYLQNCRGDDASQTCILTECGTEFLALPDECRSCFLNEGISAVAGGDITTAIQACTTETKFDYAYDGNNGILLVSKYSMKDKGSLGLTSYGNYRMAIYATLHIGSDKPGVGDVQVICTGLSKLSDEEYGGVADSWADEQMTQVNEILSIPASEGISQRVIMGDFDSNLAGGYNINASNPDPVSAVITAGYYDPYFDISEDDALDCTVCPENSMVSATSETVPDHIFFMNKKGFSFESGRTFLNQFTKFENNEKEHYSLSDHYGITVKMTADHNF